MGACFDCFTTNAKTQSEVTKSYRHQCEDASYEDGNSYSGRINMTTGLEFHNKVFSSLDEAEEYVSKTAQKWENAIAVQYKLSSKIKPSAKLTRLEKQQTELRRKLMQLNDDLRRKADKLLKSKEFITCKGCKSRMDTRFVKWTSDCPICKQSFLTKTDLSKVETLEKKIADIKNKHQIETKVLKQKADKNNKNATIHWFVGGWCSS